MEPPEVDGAAIIQEAGGLWTGMTIKRVPEENNGSKDFKNREHIAFFLSLYERFKNEKQSIELHQSFIIVHSDETKSQKLIRCARDLQLLVKGFCG